MSTKSSNVLCLVISEMFSNLRNLKNLRVNDTWFSYISVLVSVKKYTLEKRKCA